MSIIYDALKKVEATSGTNAELKIKPEKKAPPPFKIYLVYLVIISFGFLIGDVIFNTFFSPKKNNPAISKNEPKVNMRADTGNKVNERASSPIVPEAAQGLKAESRPASDFTLNGIFSSENESYALINNRIVKAGDEIEGASVTRIDADTVELKSGDSLIKLSTQQNY